MAHTGITVYGNNADMDCDVGLGEDSGQEMKKHVKIYMQANGYTVGDWIPCQKCGAQAVDMHHVISRGMGGSRSRDTASNLVALCRTCHEKEHGRGTMAKDLGEKVIRWGKYEGRKMKDLPVSYLHYFWSTSKEDRKRHGLFNDELRYIQQHYAELKAQLPASDWS